MRLSVLHLMMFSRLLYSAMYSSWLLGNDFRALLEFSSWVLHQHVIVDFLHMHVNLHYTMNYFYLLLFLLVPLLSYILLLCSFASTASLVLLVLKFIIIYLGNLSQQYYCINMLFKPFCKILL